MTGPPTADEACLERTRTAVLNVLMAASAGIAASALALRWRDRAAIWRGPEGIRQALLAVLLILVAASAWARRWGAARTRLRDPQLRAGRFFRAHLISAIIASMAVPLGLVYGWFFRPRLDAVSPFWVAAIALGFLALPRASGLADLDEPTPH
jgi:hypothetical protein